MHRKKVRFTGRLVMVGFGCIGQGVLPLRLPLTGGNLRIVLQPLRGRGDFLLNVSIEVSSTAPTQRCLECGAICLDTCIKLAKAGSAWPAIQACA